VSNDRLRTNPRLARYGSWPIVIGVLLGAVMLATVFSLPVIISFSGTNILANPWALFVLIAVEDAVLLAIVYLLLIRSGVTSWSEMGFTRTLSLRSLGYGVLFGVLFVIAAAAVGIILNALGIEQTQAAQFPIENATGGGLAAIWVAGVVFAPVTEEIFFRGYLYRAMSALKGRTRGLIYSSLLFGVVHFNLPAFLPIMLGAMILAEGYRRTGDLWVPVIAHALNNAFAFTLLSLS
jgi:hypothetical protein